MLLHENCYIPIFRTLSSPLRSLIGAILMGVILTLPYLHPSWLHQLPALIFLVAVGVALYFAFLYGFLWSQLKTLMAAIFVSRS